MLRNNIEFSLLQQHQSSIDMTRFLMIVDRRQDEQRQRVETQEMRDAAEGFSY